MAAARGYQSVPSTFPSSGWRAYCQVNCEMVGLTPKREVRPTKVRRPTASSTHTRHSANDLRDPFKTDH